MPCASSPAASGCWMQLRLKLWRDDGPLRIQNCRSKMESTWNTSKDGKAVGVWSGKLSVQEPINIPCKAAASPDFFLMPGRKIGPHVCSLSSDSPDRPPRGQQQCDLGGLQIPHRGRRGGGRTEARSRRPTRSGCGPLGYRVGPLRSNLSWFQEDPPGMDLLASVGTTSTRLRWSQAQWPEAFSVSTGATGLGLALGYVLGGVHWSGRWGGRVEVCFVVGSARHLEVQ